MNFVARHISFQEVAGTMVLALADREVSGVDASTTHHVILSYSDEEDQDRALGLTGLHIETNWDGFEGYGHIESLTFDGRLLCVAGRNGIGDILVEIAAESMMPEEIHSAVDLCNRANRTRPETMA